MSGYQHVIREKDPAEGIARLTMNRPDRRNAFNDLTQDEMGEAVEEVEADLETAMKMAAAAEMITLSSKDHEEGMAAARESRRPSYEGS
ncbi:MAG: hypothetical protein ACE5Q6_04100 [Dehalococcoidia bacterium]